MKKPLSKKIPAGILSAADKAAIREEAQAALLKEMTAKAREDYFDEQKEILRRGEVPEDEIVHITIDLAPFVNAVRLDGTPFFHGYAYDVPRSQVAVLLEQMHRTWAHQDEIDGRSRSNAYRRPVNPVIGAQHAGTPTVGAAGHAARAEF